MNITIRYSTSDFFQGNLDEIDEVATLEAYETTAAGLITATLGNDAQITWERRESGRTQVDIAPDDDVDRTEHLVRDCLTRTYSDPNIWKSA
jgi:hypothetical protein